MNRQNICLLHLLTSWYRWIFFFLNRCVKKSYPEDLPTLGVVLIYLNEALSIIQRAIRSIIDRTPKNLLKEIILVDDNSSNGLSVIKRPNLCDKLKFSSLLIVNINYLEAGLTDKAFFPIKSENLKGDLDLYVKTLEQENPNIRFIRVRHNEQQGLSYARASGWKVATADVVAILDAHIEVHNMW